MFKKLHYGQRSRIRISSSLYDRETAIAGYLDSVLHCIVLCIAYCCDCNKRNKVPVCTFSVVNTRTITEFLDSIATRCTLTSKIIKKERKNGLDLRSTMEKGMGHGGGGRGAKKDDRNNKTSH